MAGTPAKNEKPTTSTPAQNNNQQRRGQKRKLKEDEPFVVHENGMHCSLYCPYCTPILAFIKIILSKKTGNRITLI